MFQQKGKGSVCFTVLGEKSVICHYPTYSHCSSMAQDYIQVVQIVTSIKLNISSLSVAVFPLSDAPEPHA